MWFWKSLSQSLFNDFVGQSLLTITHDPNYISIAGEGPSCAVVEITITNIMNDFEGLCMGKRPNFLGNEHERSGKPRECMGKLVC